MNAKVPACWLTAAILVALLSDAAPSPARAASESSTGAVPALSVPGPVAEAPPTAPRGRPRVNGTTLVADNGRLLRGPFASTEWGDPPPYANIEAIKELGQNAVHLYGEVFDPDYPAAGSTAPGYAASRIDAMVQMTRDAGLYLVITIGNGAENGKFNRDFVLDFWNFYAPRYKDETHVIYEIQNEPFAWSTPYSQPTLEMERDAYTLIRSQAPDTPILLFSISVLQSGASAVADITWVSNAAAVDWTNAAVAFHGYAGWRQTTASVETILAAGFPVFMTEFTAADWGESGHDVQDIELTAELERLGVSWLSFLHVPPNFINSAVTDALAFREIVDRAGVSWEPDYGSWPVPRGVYGNDGRPRATSETWTDQVLTGTLRIEAEDFDTGGEGVAYHDTSTANAGGAARPDESVDLFSSAGAGGGLMVGATDAGEWLEYTVFIREPGHYDLRARYAAGLPGRLRVACDGTDVTGEWILHSSGGASTWATATRQVFLGFGRQKMRVDVIDGGLNLDWIELSPAVAGPIANGTYKIVNRRSAKALQGVTAGGAVVQNPFTSASHQLWNIQHLGAGNYKIASATNGWSWSVFYTRDDDPLDFVGWWTVESKYQRYLAVPTDSGFVRLMPVQGGLSVGIEDASMSNQARARQYAYSGASSQHWAVQPAAAPAIPTGLRVTLVSPTHNRLTWSASSGALNYTIGRADHAAGPFETIASGVSVTEYNDTEARPGAGHYYVVSATATGGQSLNSAPAAGAIVHLRLPFDEASGTTAVDVTARGWDGSLESGAAWETGKFVGATDLDGVDDHLKLPTGVVGGLSACTIAAWVNLDSTPGWVRLFDFGSGTGKYMFLSPRNAATGVVRFAITDGSGEKVVDGTAPLPTGVWTHVAATLGDGVAVIYVNGLEVGRASGVGLSPSALGATTQNYIGRSQWPSDPYLDGRIDEFRIYASALTASEIALLVAEEPVAAPVFVSQPVAVTKSAGGRIDLSVEVEGTGALTYQWRIDGEDIPGATGVTYSIPSAQAYHAGTYSVRVSSAGGTRISAGAEVRVEPAPASQARLENLSTRAYDLTGDNILIPGFVIAGTGSKRLLIRAVGQGMWDTFKLEGFLPDAELTVRNQQSGEVIAANGDWGANPDPVAIVAASQAVGAFPLAEGSSDAVLLVDLPPGHYTTPAPGVAGSTGIAMVELYDVDGDSSSAQVVNLSNRGFVDIGHRIMIPGFVVSSEGSCTVLVRAVGPGLHTTFGLEGVLSDPVLTIYRGAEAILSNDDWISHRDWVGTAAVAGRVGAFGLEPGSNDAALVVTLPPGPYTIHATGKGSATGIALVELYLVTPTL